MTVYEKHILPAQFSLKHFFYEKLIKCLKLSLAQLDPEKPRRASNDNLNKSFFFLKKVKTRYGIESWIEFNYLNAAVNLIYVFTEIKFFIPSNFYSF